MTANDEVLYRYAIGAPGEGDGMLGLMELYDAITARADLDARARLAYSEHATDLIDDPGVQAGIAVGATAAITYLMERGFLRKT